MSIIGNFYDLINVHKRFKSGFAKKNLLHLVSAKNTKHQETDFCKIAVKARNLIPKAF